MIVSGQVMFHEALSPLLTNIDSVQQHPENYNNGDVDKVQESILVNGMYRPIYVQKSTGYIIAGNHTWEACKGLGADEVPVVVLDVNDTEARRIMMADNRIAALAMPDHAAEVALLDRIIEVDGRLDGTGYTEHDREVLRHLAELELETDEFGQWPTLTFTVHPRLVKAFRHITREADTDRDRFEVLLRLAGWDGS